LFSHVWNDLIYEGIKTFAPMTSHTFFVVLLFEMTWFMKGLRHHHLTDIRSWSIMFEMTWFMKGLRPGKNSSYCIRASFVWNDLIYEGIKTRKSGTLQPGKPGFEMTWFMKGLRLNWGTLYLLLGHFCLKWPDLWRD